MYVIYVSTSEKKPPGMERPKGVLRKTVIAARVLQMLQKKISKTEISQHVAAVRKSPPRDYLYPSRQK